MKRLDHVGIAVSDLASAERIFSDVLGSEPFKREEVVSESVKVSFFKTGQGKLELLQSLSPDGPIARHIDKRGEGLHHIAFHVEDLEGELKRLQSLGYRRVSGPKPGANNKRVAFLHPGDTGKVLVELCADQ